MAELATFPAKMANPPCNHLPVTPPADHDTCANGLFPNPSHPFAQALYGALDPNPQRQSPSPRVYRPSGCTQWPHSNSQAQDQSVPLSQPQTQTQPTQSQPPFSPMPGPTPQLFDRAGNAIDPRVVAMASRISAYYQQRCQAISAYQQQRYQQWASMQRQKCQDMMQAAMLVVAWYVRDRVSRRRRRAKHQFKRGLSRRTGAVAGPAKGERLRGWVLDVPDDVVSARHGGRERPADPQEDGFSFDQKEGKTDRDSKLFQVADDLIKSQVGKIEVPLLGLLDLEDSESDSDSDEEGEEEYEQGDQEMEYEEEVEEDEDGDERQQAADVVTKQERMGSQDVQVSSGNNSRKRTRSSCGS